MALPHADTVNTLCCMYVCGQHYSPTAAPWERRNQEETLQRTLPPSVLSINAAVALPLGSLQRRSGGNYTVPVQSKASYRCLFSLHYGGQKKF